jgi:hypothetical protein
MQTFVSNKSGTCAEFHLLPIVVVIADADVSLR